LTGSVRSLGRAFATMGRFIRVGVLSLASFVPQILIASAAFKGFNAVSNALSGNLDAARRRMAGFNEEASRAQSAAEAAALATRLLDTSIRALRNQTNENDRRRLLEGLGELQFDADSSATAQSPLAEQIKILRSQAGELSKIKNEQRAITLLEKLKTSAIRETRVQQQKEFEAVNRERASAQESLLRLKDRQQSPILGRFVDESGIEELESRLSDLDNRNVELSIELTGGAEAIEQFKSVDEQYQIFEEAFNRRTDRINQLFSEFGPESRVAKLELDIASGETSQRMIERQIQSLNESIELRRQHNLETQSENKTSEKQDAIQRRIIHSARSANAQDGFGRFVKNAKDIRESIRGATSGFISFFKTVDELLTGNIAKTAQLQRSTAGVLEEARNETSQPLEINTKVDTGPLKSAEDEIARISNESEERAGRVGDRILNNAARRVEQNAIPPARIADHRIGVTIHGRTDGRQRPFHSSVNTRTQ